MSAERAIPTAHIANLRALLLASQRFRQAIADSHDLGVREVVVLGHLAAADAGLTPSQLAKRMLIGSGTLTAVLDRLVAGDYARRVPNPQDRRSSVVELTESGENFVQLVNEQLEAVLTAAATDTTADSPVTHLARLANALDERADHHAAAGGD
ncbi:MAG TPA: MarR family transcriptional regulator [Flexivirga sp.]|uniref:MarR family winged helix-turn-helix transcriptional regulator n=1 Tax=Flexivirga sp. TaxID=1962927 RepID=UPI002C9236B0|nr:MarR family transcriptional regulator [Flexivirga sp.]HWC21036.1 MarR family transcriptional regulator [Flexivirga sp.]